MDGNQPLVSIITITHNRGDLIHRCIESIAFQTYTNIEHIIVDGASTDRTQEVVKSYQQKDSRLKYILLKENLSIPETIWLGFEKSQGQYITFLDDDDEYCLTKIEMQVQKFSELADDYGMVYCWMTYYDTSTMQQIRLHAPKLRGDVAEDVVSDYPIISGTPTLMIRRDIFEKSGGWKEDIGIVSDWEFATRICQICKVDYVPESLIKIYVNHSHRRMSNTGYYKSFWEKDLKFRRYWLQKYSTIYDKFPNRKENHLYSLEGDCISLHYYKDAFVYYKQLLSIKKSFRNCFSPIVFLALNVKRALSWNR